MSKGFKNIDFINNTELDLPKTFSTVVNNDDILQMYLKEIGKKKILNKNEEMELGKLIQEGSPKFTPSCQHSKKVYWTSSIIYGLSTRGLLRTNKGC